MKKRTLIAILTVALIVSAVVALGIGAMADGLPFQSLFSKLIGGYTSDEGQFLAPEYFSSETISVSKSDQVWFGPCDPTQYFQLVGQDAGGKTVTDKIRGKELTVVDTFANGMVIYRYTVPAGISKLVFTAPASVAEVYTVAKTEITELTWRAYWTMQGKQTDSYVGESSYYELKAGDKLYFGAVTEAQALASTTYGSNGQVVGTMTREDLTLVESFGGAYGIYCYTVPEGVSYTRVAYDIERAQYYYSLLNPAEESAVTAQFIRHYAIQTPVEATVEKLSGKTALFLGDSITFGARDRANIYGVVDSVNPGAGGWAARIGYYTGMKVTNNGVSGACITTARQESHSDAHYIYNNLVKTAGTTYDYVIMHGLFNDASIPVELGEAQGKANFDPAKADVTKFASALELLFYTARQQNPEAILGYIVNFHTDRAVEQGVYVAMALKICEDWGIEYLNLYELKDFEVEFDDGLHPSSAGYDSMYTIVANWMASLDGDLSTNPSSNKVLSYNVYYGADLPDSTGLSVTDRYLKVVQKIVEEDADIVMMQEYTGVFDNIFQENATAYSVYGQVHSASYGDERAPIAWKTDKYDLAASGSFEVPGDWCSGKQYPRAVNWVLLKEKLTGKQLLVMSVHAQPDDENEEARNKMMLLVAQKAAELSQQYGAPIIMGGDFNMGQTSQAYKNLTETGLLDVCMTVNADEIGSYNAWTREDGKFAKGDYLFMSAGVNALTFQVVTDDLDTGRTDGNKVHISDHSPLVSYLFY